MAIRTRIVSEFVVGKASVRGCRKLLIAVIVLAVGSTLCFGQARPAFQSVRIGAFDADAWNGVVFLTRAFDQPAAFAVRVGSQRGGGFLDGGRIFDAVTQVGPHAPGRAQGTEYLNDQRDSAQSRQPGFPQWARDQSRTARAMRSAKV